MSEDAPDRPLTRRELRLRAMVETGAVRTISDAEKQVQAEAEAAARAEAAAKAAEAETTKAKDAKSRSTLKPKSTPVATTPQSGASRASEATVDNADDIEISHYNDDGTMRTRREMRALREQAFAARRPAKKAPEEPVAAEEPAAKDEPVAAEEPAATDEPEAPEEPAAPAQSSREELDPRLEDTQPFTIADLEAVNTAEFAEPKTSNDDPDSPADVSVGDEASAVEDSSDLPKAAVEPEDGIYYPSVKAPDPEQSSDEPEPVNSADEPELVNSEAEHLPKAGMDSEANSESSQEATGEANEPKSASAGYSFPDIAPLDENVSVFDRPATRTGSGVEGGEDSEHSGDFDDLIHRAVAEESSPRTTNTSALILPTLPSSGGLSGPLGETGELFITGSVEMPKSMGETGRQTAVHDSSDLDPLDELGFDSVQTTDDSNAPVSAKRAVSSTGSHEPIGRAHSKEKSKMPLVLILTGGALVIAVAGLVTWAATSGMFG